MRTVPNCSVAAVALVSLLAGSCSSSGGTTSTQACGGQAQGGDSSAGASGIGAQPAAGGDNTAGMGTVADGDPSGGMPDVAGSNAGGALGEAGASDVTSSGTGGLSGGSGDSGGAGGASGGGLSGLGGTSGSSGGGGASAGSGGTVVNAPAITITSSPDDFGRVATGEASGSISFTATNTSGVSTGPLTQSITGTGAASFKLVSSTCVGATLAPAASCSVIVRFIPATVGAKSALLALSGGPGETGNATLLGTAIVPPVLTYTSVAFGNVFDGDSKDATVLVSNPIEAQTSGPITFSMTSTNPSCATSGPASPCFTLLPFAAGDCVSGTTVLGPGATCNVRVHFTPLTTIGSVQGSLAVSANPGSSPALHDVPLTGTGLTTITVNPTLYDFGQVNVFNAAYETFTITNVSDENQSSVNAFFTGVADALAIIDDSCFNGPLAPHATCTIAVQYVPEANGDFTDAFLDISFADGFAQAEITGTSPN